jgi:hypothetical protein
MKMTKEFISGFTSAVHSLGQEGDQRGTDWSKPYEYLTGMLNRFDPVGETLPDALRFRGGLCAQAADEIERLTRERDHAIENEARERAEHDELRAGHLREIERLRAVLQKIASLEVTGGAAANAAQAALVAEKVDEQSQKGNDHA